MRSRREKILAQIQKPTENFEASTVRVSLLDSNLGSRALSREPMLSVHAFARAQEPCSLRTRFDVALRVGADSKERQEDDSRFQ
jgi:hypothetical protein